MSAAVDTLRRLSVAQVARMLEIHPFDVVRILTVDQSLPADLRLDASLVERVRQRGGLETWWKASPVIPAGEIPARVLGRLMVRQLLDRDLVHPRSTRADNLFRGLDPEAQVVLRRAVNALIREQFLTSHMAAEGLRVALHPTAAAQLRASAGGPLPSLDAILERP